MTFIASVVLFLVAAVAALIVFLGAFYVLGGNRPKPPRWSLTVAAFIGCGALLGVVIWLRETFILHEDLVLQISGAIVGLGVVIWIVYYSVGIARFNRERRLRESTPVHAQTPAESPRQRLLFGKFSGTDIRIAAFCVALGDGFIWMVREDATPLENAAFITVFVVCVIAALDSYRYVSAQREPLSDSFGTLADEIAKKAASEVTQVDHFKTKKGDLLLVWAPNASVEQVLGAFGGLFGKDDEKAKQAKASRDAEIERTRQKIAKVFATDPDADLERDFAPALQITIERIERSWMREAGSPDDFLESELRKARTMAEAEKTYNDFVNSHADLSDQMKKRLKNRFQNRVRQMMDDE